MVANVEKVLLGEKSNLTPFIPIPCLLNMHKHFNPPRILTLSLLNQEMRVSTWTNTKVLEKLFFLQWKRNEEQ